MTDPSRDFRAMFDLERKAIDQLLDTLCTVPKTEVQAAMNDLRLRIHRFKETVSQNITLLPPSDARTSLETITIMNERLALLRGTLVPRPKFAFKTRQAITTSMEVDPALLRVADVPVTSPMTDQWVRFENRTDEHLWIGSIDDSLLKKPVKDVQVTLSQLVDCTISLVYDIALSSVHLCNLTRCRVVIPPVHGNVVLDSCVDCTVVGACQQVRMLSSSKMWMYLFVGSKFIIEDCTEVLVAPYGEVLPDDRLNRLFEAAGLERDKNMYDQVKDRSSMPGQTSPHWRLLDASAIQGDVAAGVLGLSDA